MGGRIVYRTIKVYGGVISPPQLKQMGEDGWKLGGVSTSTVLGPSIGIGMPPPKSTVHHYHFWKESYRS